MLDRGNVSKVCQEGSDYQNDGDGHREESQGSDDAAGNAGLLVAHKGGDIDGNDAGGTLADGKVIHDFLGSNPVPVIHQLPLQEGQHGVSAAEIHRSDFQEGDVENQQVMHVRFRSFPFRRTHPSVLPG